VRDDGRSLGGSGFDGAAGARLADHASPEVPSSEQLSISSSAPMAKSKVIIGIHDLAFHQEVLDWLDRDFRVDVVGASGEPDRLLQLFSRQPSDVALLCPLMARQLAHPAARPQLPRVLLVAQEMTVPVLRDAIEMGAQGVFAWPDEREELLEVVSAQASHASAPVARGRVVVVLGARGGAGTTFLATHVAATFARGGLRCALVDLEAGVGDLTVALGIGSEDRPRTITDLLPVMHELAFDHILDVLHKHPAGFVSLLAPPDETGRQAVPEELFGAAIALIAAEFQVVVVHLPRGITEAVRGAVELADELLLVVTLDLFSLFGARRTMTALGLNERHGAICVVVNRLARGEVTMADVERVIGVRPTASIRFDPAVRRAQDRGELLSLRSRRAGIDVRKLGRMLVAGWADPRGQEGA
jgi:pilus assembly protein CpaE